MSEKLPPPDFFYCFESAECAALQRELVPAISDSIFAWEDLVGRLSGDAPHSEAERLHTLETFLNADEVLNSVSWLKTIELLREALVLSHQDVDYLFQSLPVTPRNTRLQEVFHAYLDSRAGEDWTSRAWNAVERIRERTTPEGLPRIVFVKGAESSALFLELAQNYARLFAGEMSLGDALKEAWEFSLEGRPSRIRAAESSQCLERIARLSNHRAQAQRATLVAFGGSWAEQTFLECLWARDKNTLSRVVPFTALPVLPEDTALIVYAGKTVFELDPRELLLSGAELDTLARAGFPVVSERGRYERRKARYEGLANVPGLFFYSSFERQERETRPARRLQFGLKREAASVYTDSMQAQIGRRRLSASQLELYADCPSRHFFQSGLKLQKTLPGDDASYAWVFGQAAHLALERYFQINPNPVEPEGMISLFDQAAQETVPGLAEKTTLRVTMQEHFRKIALQIPRLEEHLTDVFGAHEPILFEHKFEVKLGDVELSGMIDRLDELSDGSLLVLDYKTGSVDFTPNHITDGSNFQALLYTIAAESFKSSQWAGLLFYDLKEFEVRRGIIKDFAVPKEKKAKLTRGHVLAEEKLERIREEGLAHIQRIGASITAGDFTATPSRVSCDRCDFPQFCRKAQDYE